MSRQASIGSEAWTPPASVLAAPKHALHPLKNLDPRQIARAASVSASADSLFGEPACDHAGDGDELVGAVWTWALLGLRDTASVSGSVARPGRHTGCDANGRRGPLDAFRAASVGSGTGPRSLIDPTRPG